MKKLLGILVIVIALVGIFLYVQEPSGELAQPTGSIELAEEPGDVGLLEAEVVDDLPDTADYLLDTSTSTLEWESTRLTGKQHIGTVALASGILEVENGAYVGGSFVIDMTQISESNNNERFLVHVRSEDFFNVEQYPTATFVINNMTEEEEGRVQISGDLTILDQTHAISFPAQMTMSASGVTAIAEFTIDRTKWGITFDSGSFFQQLGDRAIKDEITFRLNLAFSQKG